MITPLHKQHPSNNKYRKAVIRGVQSLKNSKSTAKMEIKKASALSICGSGETLVLTDQLYTNNILFRL